MGREGGIVDALRRTYVLGAGFLDGLEFGVWEFFFFWEHFGSEFDDVAQWALVTNVSTNYDTTIKTRS